MIVQVDIDYIGFEASCNVLLSSLPFASERMCEKAGKEILADSQIRVPKDTLTLMSTGYYEVSGQGRGSDVIIGYADRGHDAYNPKGKKLASEYVVVVHEDMEAFHRIGEAKFLWNAWVKWISNYPSHAKQVFRDLGLI